MSHAFASKQEPDRSGSSPSSVRGDDLPPASYSCTDGVRCDPKDPVHADVHRHLIDDLVSGPVMRVPHPLSASMGTGIAGMGPHPLSTLAGVGFGAGDWMLAHGGQVVLDGMGFVPGINVLTEGAQSGYHTAHALYDVAEGNDAAAREESAEAGWHGAAALLDAATAEGGNEVKAAGRAANHASHAKHMIHDIHKVVDVGEAAWDLTSTLMRGLGGSKEQLPFFGALRPWIANGAGRNTEDTK